MEHYRIRVGGDDLIFSAAHFITLEDGSCESVHGHDYKAAAEVAGPLNESRYVVDFVALHDVLRAVLAEVDHRVLLPTEHPRIRVEAGQQEVEVHFESRRWLFPRDDCALLPVANMTAELLARHLGRRLLAEFANRTGAALPRLRIELSESPGFVAVWEWSAGE